MAVFKPGLGTDDCLAQQGGPSFYISLSYLGFGKSDSTGWDTGVRFTNVTIAQGAIIGSAKVTFQSYDNDSGTACNVRIKGEDADDVLTFSDYTDYAGRVRTTEYVDWSNIPAWTVNLDYDTSPDISSIIQEIVDRPGWVSGNDLVLFFADNVSDSNAGRYPKSYELTTTLCARLTVTWTEPSESMSPSVSPSSSPSISPSGSPSLSPSASVSPSQSPSLSPSASISPSESPSMSPSASISPSMSPSSSPSISPSSSPSLSPSASISPSVSPSLSPSASLSPSESPSLSPSASISPSISPSGSPSVSPSRSPSVSPSVSPSASPSPEPGILSVELPLIEVSFTGHEWQAVLSATLPLIQSSISGLTGEIGQVKMEIPLIGVSVEGRTSVTGNVSVKLPLIDVGISGLSGVIGSFSLTLPLLTASWTELPDRVGSFSITLPVITPIFSGRIIPITFNRKAIVVNLSNRAVTEYKNYSFNSFMMFNGVLLGTSEQGLYILDGDNDLGVPIESYIQTGTYDLGEGAIKTPKEAWLAYRSDGDMDIEVKEDELNVYNHILNKVATGIRECRAKLGKGLKGRFYRFGIKNLGGSSFDLQSFRVLAEIIRRKTR